MKLTYRSNRVRIIGGKWRGRLISIAAHANIRPTSDRIRETLFNWLRNDIAGASCLDLFAGAGALGFEALSRGAKTATLVDADHRVIQQLQTNAQQLGIKEEMNLIHGQAPDCLATSAARFDIVFLDPPYLSSLLTPSSHYLVQHHRLVDFAKIYVETSAEAPTFSPPTSWQLLNSKQSGKVIYQLWRHDPR